jgi:hypothetical protein
MATYEPASKVARRLRRDARKADPFHSASRHWCGWRIALSFGSPSEEQGFPALVALMRAHDARPENVAKRAAARVAEQVFCDVWHMSASWRGGYPVEDGKRALDELLVAMEVPDADRAGHQPARVFGPNGQSPQVTHWFWRVDPMDESS